MLIKHIRPTLFTGMLALLSLRLLAQNPGFVQTDVIKVSGVTSNAQVNTLPLGQIQTTRVFIDGLGRPVQSVALQASPVANKDIVQPEVYNTLGQQTTGYLPYTDNAVTHPSGSFRTTAISDQLSYYTQSGTSTNPNGVAHDALAPFSQQVFEASPMQRVTSAGMTGTGFQPGVTGNKYKTVSYRLNNATQDGNIMIWSTSGTFASTYYADNKLYVTDGTDEDGLKVRTFTDAAGRLILKRQLNASAYVDTYYVYNLGGVISYVIPPLALASMVSSGNYSLSASPVKTMIFIFTYDSMGRLIEKTVPAKGKMNIIYDPLNRPVLTQDSNLCATNKWTYIKYDVKGRVISTGLYTDVTYTTRTAMQAHVNTLNYTTAWFETQGGTATSATGWYSNNIFPNVNCGPLAYSYYDDYDIDKNGATNFAYATQGLTGEGTPTTAQLKGMPTMTRVCNVGSGFSGKWFMTAVFYDKNLHKIQTRSNNHLYYADLILTDSKTVAPDFTGAPLIAKTVIQTAASITTTVQTNLRYDNMYRVLSVDQYYNGSSTVSHIAAYTYNEMGQVIKKGLGYVSATAWLQNVDLRYNIRGQLLSINNSQLTSDGGLTNGDTNDVFGMSILYDQSDSNLGNTSYYNGRISAVKWMSKDGSGNKTPERAFRYGYDGINRYNNSYYSERPGTGAFTYNSGFNESINYDVGGNITVLARNSCTIGGTTPVQIDYLTYTYDASNPNQLNKVTDGTDANHTGAGFRNLTGSTGSYTYDGNGNLASDPYKALTLGYNALNKTDKITVTTGTNRWVDYTYGSDGTLLRKRQFDVSATTPVTTTDYIDGFVYVTAGAGTPALQYFGMPEGRVVNTGTASAPIFTQEYIITDQQGNARVSFQNNGSNVAVVKQENSYYATGMIMPNSPVAMPTTPNKQLYNGGAEWQNDYANLPDYYQTFYRNYDAALARWVGVDPMAESAESMTTYQYAGNNPVMFNDPDGDLIPYEYASGEYSPSHGGQGSGVDYMAAKFAQMDADAAEDQQIQNYFDFLDDLQGVKGPRPQQDARDQRIHSPTLESAANNTANQLTAESYHSWHWNPYGGGTVSRDVYIRIPGHETNIPEKGGDYSAGAWEDGSGHVTDINANQGGPVYNNNMIVDDGGFNNGGGGGGPNDRMRGGRQSQRDRSIKRYPKEFQRWYHKEIKPDVHPGRDATPEELEEGYRDWLDQGSPSVKTVATGLTWGLIGWGVYETVKWGGAIILAPETGGGSLVGAGVLP